MVNLIGAARFNNLTLLHDHDTVADIMYYRQIMRYKDDGKPEFFF